MLDVLNAILCWIQAIANLFLWAIMTAINGIIAAIGLILMAVIALLPNMPSNVEWTGISADVFAYVNWVFPLGVLIATIGTLAVLWVAWNVIAVVLRWGKAIQ